MAKNVKRQFPNPKELAPLLKFAGPKFNRKKARLAKAFTIWDLRDIAKKRTPQGPFDYTDGAAESEASLDRAPVPLNILASINKEFKKDLEIHVDTGIMHGADILAAIALGARYTYVGRAYLYGLMAGGQDGVEKALEILRTQMIRNMKLLGVRSLSELNPKHVRFLEQRGK